MNLPTPSVPLFANGRELTPIYQPGVLSTSIFVPLLIAALGLPLSAAHSFPLQEQKPKDWRVQNADTSHGTPKTLLGELKLPVGKTVQLVPHRFPWLPADTTADQPQTVRTQPLPVGKTVQITPQSVSRKDWLVQNGDTSHGIPKPLLSEVRPPPITAEARLLPTIAYPQNNWLPADTSRSLTVWQMWGEIRVTWIQFQVPAAPARPPTVHIAPVRSWWQPADTSQDVPKTLLPEASLPLNVASFFAAQGKQWLVVDTTADQPVTLKQIPAPVVPSQFVGQLRQPSQNADTSSDTPLTLTTVRPFVVAPSFAQIAHPLDDRLSDETSRGFIGPDATPPIFVAPSFSPVAYPRNNWLPADTSRGFTGPDQTPPISVKPQFAPVSQAGANWLPSDTSRGAALTLRAVGQPTVPILHSVPPKFWWQPADSSQETAKSLTPDAAPPLFVAPAFAVAKPPPWQVVDTTASRAKPLIAEVRLPIGADEQLYQPNYPHSVVDTSSGTPKTLKAESQTPVCENFEFLPPDRVRPVTDTSVGTPKALTQDASLPPVAPQVAPVLRPAISSDTSQGQPLALKTVPTVIPPVHVAPIARPDVRLDTSAGTALTLKTAQTPSVPASHFSPIVASAANWLPADTSRGEALTLRDAGQAPTVPILHLSPAKFWWQPPDTSQSVAKTLTLDAQRISVAPQFAPVSVSWLLLNTSSGSSLALKTPQTPVVPVLHSAPARNVWQPADASQGEPLVLKTPPLPVEPAPNFAPLRFFWQPLDSSQGSPETLRPERQSPFVAPQIASDRARFVVVDTSQSSSTALLTPSPLSQAVHVSPVDYRRLFSDTSLGTPKALTRDQTTPVFVVAQPLVKSWWQPADVSAGTPKTLTTEPLPQGQTVQLAPVIYRWLAGDTTAQSAKPLTAETSLPFFVLPQPLVKSWWQPADSSQGTPELLRPEPRLPFIATPQPILDGLRPVADTSHGVPVELLVTPPPGVAIQLPPIGYRWNNGDTSQGSFAAEHAAPVANVPFWSSPQFVWESRDTSSGTVRALFPPPLPPGATVQLAPVGHRWLASDTTAATPKTLKAELRPFEPQPQPVPDAIRPVTDTSRGSPAGLLVVLPPGMALQFGSIDFWWHQTNTSSSTPKTLYKDVRRLTKDDIDPDYVVTTDRVFTVDGSGRDFLAIGSGRVFSIKGEDREFVVEATERDFKVDGT